MSKLLRTGLVPARAVERVSRGHIAPTERLKLRRPMAAAAAGKKESLSLSLFVEVKNLEVEEELSTVASLLGRKVSGWDGEGGSRRLGGSRSSKCRHGGM